MNANVHIMGIVNLTQDSFYAGSRTSIANVVSRAQQMWADGATVVDLGACSTRPGAPQPSLEEEWSRLEPALREMAGYCPTGTCAPPHMGRGRGPPRQRWEGPERAKRTEFLRRQWYLPQRVTLYRGNPG